MLLYCSALEPVDHAVRVVFREKRIEADIRIVREENRKLREDVADLNPSGAILTLTDRHLVLYEAQLIAEFLDERYPFPPLMPVDPVLRAHARQLRQRIINNLYPPLCELLYPGNEIAVAGARNVVRDQLSTMASMFSRRPFQAGEDLSMIDCFIAPVLWRLSGCGIQLPPSALRHIRPYARRLFAHGSFKRSLIEEDRDYNGL